MELFAEKREIKGRKVKNLRNEGLIPAVLYSTSTSRGEKEVQNISINLGEFRKVYKESGSSALVSLKINGLNPVNVLIHEVQLHPLHLTPLHVGLYEVNMKEEIETEVPITLVNAEVNEAVKSGEGILITVLSSVNVKSLPGDIPHEFEVDTAVLKAIGDVITVADLDYNKDKVEILNDAEEVIVKLDFAQQLENEEEGPTSAADVEVIKEKKDIEEGSQEPSEGNKDSE